jgi:hypothetical protein
MGLIFRLTDIPCFALHFSPLLKTHTGKPGRGRKAILDAQTDLESVRQAVRGNRQRLRVAKADLEEALGKSFSDKTLRRFLKETLHAINASENVPVKNQIRTSTN